MLTQKGVYNFIEIVAHAVIGAKQRILMKPSQVFSVLQNYETTYNSFSCYKTVETVNKLHHLLWIFLEPPSSHDRAH